MAVPVTPSAPMSCSLLGDVQVDKFEVEAVSLGQLSQCLVGHEETRSGGGWYLESIVVREAKNSGKEFLFPCNKSVTLRSLYYCSCCTLLLFACISKMMSIVLYLCLNLCQSFNVACNHKHVQSLCPNNLFSQFLYACLSFSL